MVVWLILADTEGRAWLWRTLAVKTGAQTNHFATRNLVWFYFFTNNLKSSLPGPGHTVFVLVEKGHKDGCFLSGSQYSLPFLLSLMLTWIVPIVLNSSLTSDSLRFSTLDRATVTLSVGFTGLINKEATLAHLLRGSTICSHTNTETKNKYQVTLELYSCNIFW